MSEINYKAQGSARLRVTSQMATDMLGRNLDNRPLSVGRVREYMAKMEKLKELRARLRREPKDGEIVAVDGWLFTHQGIGFDVNGRLIDGQHRLTAQARTGIDLDWIVTTGLAPEAFDRTDVGDMRSASDLLSRRLPDLKNKSLCAAVARAAMLGIRDHHIDKITVVDFVETNHEMLTAFVSVLVKNPTTKRAPVIAAFVAAARTPDDTFVGPRGFRDLTMLLVTAERLAAQDWLPRKDDPMKTLHSRLVADERRSLKVGRMTEPKTLYALTVSAVRAELAGRGLTLIPGTDIDWGDPGDAIREGTGDLRAKRSQATAKAYEEGRKVATPATAAPLLAAREAKRIAGQTAVAGGGHVPSTVVRRAR